VLDPAHYQRHLLKPHYAARESLCWMLQLPEEGLAGLVYTWVSCESRAGAALCFFGPAVGDEPIFEMLDGVVVPHDHSFTDWRVGGLRLNHGERDECLFVGDAASIGFTFEGTHPPYNYAAHPDGPLPWMADDRFEQSGRWEGTLQLRIRTIPFDTISHRDQSWGIRDWGMCQHCRWPAAHAGPGASVQFTQNYVIGHVNVRGYVYRDGEQAQITAVDIDYDLAPDMVHRTLNAVEDDAGRTTTVHGRTYANMEFPFPPTTTIIVCADTVAIEGQPGAGQFDVLWTTDYINYVRQHGLPKLPKRSR
jgi:hypothetical protein